MWVRFSEPFDWSPKYGVTLAYRAGVYNVTRRCADAAIKAGKAEKTTDRASGKREGGADGEA